MAYHTRTRDNTVTKKIYDEYIDLESYDSDDDNILPSVLVDELEEEELPMFAEKEETNARYRRHLYNINISYSYTHFSDTNEVEDGWTRENTLKTLPVNHGSFGVCNLTAEEQQDELSLFFKYIPMEFFYTLVEQTNIYIAEKARDIIKKLHFWNLTLFRGLLSLQR